MILGNPTAVPGSRSPPRFAWPGGSPGRAAQPCPGGSGRCPASLPALLSAPAGGTQQKSRPQPRDLAHTMCPTNTAWKLYRKRQRIPGNPARHRSPIPNGNLPPVCQTGTGNLPRDLFSSRQCDCGKMGIYLYCFKEEFIFLPGSDSPPSPPLAQDALSSKIMLKIHLLMPF